MRLDDDGTAIEFVHTSCFTNWNGKCRKNGALAVAYGAKEGGHVTYVDGTGTVIL